jgi:hypothetical protein
MSEPAHSPAGAPTSTRGGHQAEPAVQNGVAPDDASKGPQVDNGRVETLRAGYSAVCDAYHKIDDFRAKLLALLPLASGTGVFLLLDTPGTLTPEDKSIYTAVGLLGLLTTLGLFVYELGGVLRCRRLIQAGRALERELKLLSDDGRPFAVFGALPAGPLGWLRGQALAALIIYPTVLGGWAYLYGVGRGRFDLP